MKKLNKILGLSISLFLSGCSISFNKDDQNKENNNQNTNISQDDENFKDENTVVEIPSENETETETELVESSDNSYTFKDSNGNLNTINIECVSGTNNGFVVDNNKIDFNNINEDSVYSISGKYIGYLNVNINENYKLELELNGFTLVSYSEAPIVSLSADKLKLSAKKETNNYIYDYRELVTDENLYSASIYAENDLGIQGKGNLYVFSKYNNGIHSKDDIEVKNLNLQVECVDNALKGNDSVTIESGNITLIATGGDCIKTTNSSISSKLKQKGTVTISGGYLLLYSTTDAIDASYDVIINESTSNTYIQAYTDKYSQYSDEVINNSSNCYYIRTNTKNYSYAICYIDSNNNKTFKTATFDSTLTSPRSTYYLYKVEKIANASQFVLYAYTSSQTIGSEDNYYAKSSNYTLNTNYDTISAKFNSNSISISWTNKSTTNMNNNFGPMGGFNDGNKDKNDYSSKGIKADNSINISAGKILIHSYDDAIHTNTDNQLENGETPTGLISIDGGELELYSNDDGIHADGNLIINNGSIRILKSYEGIEGKYIEINNGEVSIISSDDGMNSTITSGTGIKLNGGIVYIYASGDGIDCNSYTNGSIAFNGSDVVIIQTSGGNSAIDCDGGYNYYSGNVVAIGNSGGMTNETTNCRNNSQKTTKTISLTNSTYLVVDGIVAVKMPQNLNAFVVVVGNNNATITSSSNASGDLNLDNVIWY